MSPSLSPPGLAMRSPLFPPPSLHSFLSPQSSCGVVSPPCTAPKSLGSPLSPHSTETGVLTNPSHVAVESTAVHTSEGGQLASSKVNLIPATLATSLSPTSQTTQPGASLGTSLSPQTAGTGVMADSLQTSLTGVAVGSSLSSQITQSGGTNRNVQEPLRESNSAYPPNMPALSSISSQTTQPGALLGTTLSPQTARTGVMTDSLTRVAVGSSQIGVATEATQNKSSRTMKAPKLGAQSEYMQSPF